ADSTCNIRGLLVTELIASAPFMIRFMMTCCNWVRSPETFGRLADKLVRKVTPRLCSELWIKARTSLIVPFRSSAIYSGLSFCRSVRIRSITSLARFASFAVEGRPSSGNIWHVMGQPAQGCVAIVHNGGERLVDFMCNGCRELPHRRQSGRARELRLRFLQRRLVEFALGHIHRDADIFGHLPRLLKDGFTHTVKVLDRSVRKGSSKRNIICLFFANRPGADFLERRPILRMNQFQK